MDDSSGSDYLFDVGILRQKQSLHRTHVILPKHSLWTSLPSHISFFGSPHQFEIAQGRWIIRALVIFAFPFARLPDPYGGVNCFMGADEFSLLIGNAGVRVCCIIISRRAIRREADSIDTIFGVVNLTHPPRPDCSVVFALLLGSTVFHMQVVLIEQIVRVKFKKRSELIHHPSQADVRNPCVIVTAANLDEVRCLAALEGLCSVAEPTLLWTPGNQHCFKTGGAVSPSSSQIVGENGLRRSSRARA